MKHLKSLRVLLCITSLMFTSCNKEDYSTSLHLNKTALSLQEGESETLELLEGGDSGSMIWISLHPDVATVDGNGKVKAVSVGQTAVVLAVDGMSAICEVTVTSANGEPTVYVAGYEEIDGKTVATLWKNGEAVRLSGGTTNAEAYSVHVEGGDVYVAGYETIGSSRIAVLWKNGDAIVLSRDPLSCAKSVFVEGGKYYIAGDSRINQTYATLWQSKEPKQAYLTTANLSYGYSVFVANSSVYAAGQLSMQAAAWKDGAAFSLNLPSEGGSYSKASSVYVAGNDVYVAGEAYMNDRSKNTAMLWKNGTPSLLANGENETVAHTVFVEGENIYVGGYETSTIHQRRAVIWKNKAISYLTSGNDLNKGNAEIYSLFVSNNNVYAAGYERVDKLHYVAALWVNGNVTYLGNLQGTSYAHSVFVLK